jgi:multimeric flavodoxin WrbA
MANPIIILGSSRSHGDTYKAVRSIINGYPDVPFIDLNQLNITAYDYEQRNKDDDFLPLIKQALEHDTIVLATPVYWYTMSAQMKVFIDRLSDLIRIWKDTGRKLRGKNLYVITSFHTSMPRGFEDAFSQTCEYLGMNYKGCSYIHSGDHAEFLAKNPEEIKKAREAIFS